MTNQNDVTQALEDWNNLNDICGENDRYDEVLKPMLYNIKSALEQMQWRKEVVWFATLMEEKLRENDHKGGWGNCDIYYLIGRLQQECEEAYNAITNHNIKNIPLECADVANFAMMIATKFKPTPPSKEEE